MQKLEVGKWFQIDRKVIRDHWDDIIVKKCESMGQTGRDWLVGFEESNQYADDHKYPEKIETYIFEKTWKAKTEQELRDMCKSMGEGQSNNIISDLQLQMRLCNGESAKHLFEEPDELPRQRLISLVNGENCYQGGGTEEWDLFRSPSERSWDRFDPGFAPRNVTTEAFRFIK